MHPKEKLAGYSPAQLTFTASERNTMPFNYRVMRGQEGYAIHEVFYYEDGSVRGWTAKPLSVIVDSIEGLRHELELYLQALNEPALENTAT